MLALPFHFSYIVLCVPFVIAWLIIFFARKDTRKEQLSMSYIAMFAGPISEIVYFRDYWFPGSLWTIHIGSVSFMIEDFIFGFAMGGIASVIFEVVFRERLSRLSLHSKHTISLFSIFFIFALAMMAFLALGLNSIYASSLAFIIAAIPVLYYRRDLFLNAIGSGICVMLVMFVSYFLLFNVIVSNTDQIFKQGWLIYGSRLDVRLWGVPLTEMVWGFTWGFLAGPLYEFAKRKRDVALR